jgi:hypothetical protein
MMVLAIDRHVHRLAHADVGPGQVRVVVGVAAAQVEAVGHQHHLLARVLRGDDLHAGGHRLVHAARAAGWRSCASPESSSASLVAPRRMSGTRAREVGVDARPVVLDPLEQDAPGRALDDLEGPVPAGSRS